jgi:hypothetical protein
MTSHKTKKNTPARQAAQRKYNSKPEQKRRRAMRNKARAMMMKAGKVRKGDGRDVAHKDDNPMNSDPSNFLIQSPSKNRSVPRGSTGKRKRENG